MRNGSWQVASQPVKSVPHGKEVFQTWVRWVPAFECFVFKLKEKRAWEYEMCRSKWSLGSHLIMGHGAHGICRCIWDVCMAVWVDIRPTVSLMKANDFLLKTNLKVRKMKQKIHRLLTPSLYFCKVPTSRTFLIPGNIRMFIKECFSLKLNITL